MYLYLAHFAFIMLFAIIYSLLYQWPLYFLEEAIVPVSVRRPAVAEEEQKSNPLANNQTHIELNVADPVIAGTKGTISFTSL